MIRLWKHLRKNNTQSTAAEKILGQKYNEFLSVLSENEHSLDLMTRLEEKLYNDQLISFPYLKSTIHNLSKRIAHIVESLIMLSDGNYVELREIYGVLERNIREVLTGKKEPIYTPIIIPMDQIRKDLADKVGNKMANLGEMQSQLTYATPTGFAATACAFTHFLEYNDLNAKIKDVLCQLNPTDSHQLLASEKAIKQLFLEAQVPPEIEDSIRKECEKLEKIKGRAIYWAVRSSAIGEDLAESSFAGQFSSILNVCTDNVIDAYKEVAASKYNASAIVYQHMKGIRDDDVSMSVGFMEMIDPICSVVLYTTNPVQQNRQEIVVNAVWGIGELLVDGVISADVYVLKREPGFLLVKKETAEKGICLKLLHGGGLQQEIMAEKKSRQPCLNRSQLKRLAEMAMQIEKLFKGPQDIEWCFDQDDTLHILQSRSLHVFQKFKRQKIQASINAPVIADKAQPISPGVGKGEVFKARDRHDLINLPRGAVLVLKHSSPQFIGALHRVSAVIIEKGNWADHMASVIREFGVPCIVRVKDIFSRLKNGQTITVDATEGIIYSDDIAISPETINACQGSSSNIKKTESHRLLDDIAAYIFPLNLTDSRSDNFKPEACKSWHDLLRFCHETALNEMFQLKDKSELGRGENVFKIQSKLPFSLYLLDIFGTTIRENRGDIVRQENIHCLPFQKLWSGMNDPDLNWRGLEQVMRPKDLFSAMLRTPEYALQPVETKSYAIVTPEYLNLSLSMGYHFVVLDCYLSDDPFNNYISLSFKGGAAEMKKRNLRIAFIAKILKWRDVDVFTASEFVKSRIKAESAQELAAKLDTIGHMLAVTRLLDVAMVDIDMVESCVTKFYNHDYSLGVMPQ